MKSKLLMLAFFLTFAYSANAQNKSEVSATNTPTFDETGKFWIHWGTYKEWGHLPGCGGWGLCDYRDCWFCDVADKHRAKILIDPKTKKGEMLIALDPTKTDEKKAITEKLVFTISEDIEKPNSILSKGLYPFDQSVGKYGGYRLKIALK
jgi:hypothetical protein